MAKHIATWSKDESTQVGCVIVGSNKEILSCGYNGFARGVDDTISSRFFRPEKYLWTEHAERNAIYNSARIGIPLEGSVAYSTLCPCMDCARALVQSGIKKVVCPKPDLEKYKLWADQFVKAEVMYKECNVELVYV